MYLNCSTKQNAEQEPYIHYRPKNDKINETEFKGVKINVHSKCSMNSRKTYNI